MVELGNDAVYGRTPQYPTGPMNVSAMAAAVGAPPFVVDRANQISKIDFRAVLCSGPVVLDVHIDRRVRMPKNARFDNIKATTGRRALN
jgi:thiamine pyrophosphate-dependent acetolactate synthase large subunit-like protein